MDIPGSIIARAKTVQGTVVFGEGDEERTLTAAARLANDGVCRTIAVCMQKEDAEKTAAALHLDISRVEILVPSIDLLDQDVLNLFVQMRADRGFFEAEALRQALEPLYFSALYVKSGKATCFIAGARSDTADVLRAVLYGIGMMNGVKVISSFFLMVPPKDHPVAIKPVIFADCAVNPEPGAAALKDIAAASVLSFKCLFPGQEAKVAFLSFSTKGSADTAGLRKLREAVRMTQEQFRADTSVVIDGEFQFDAAVIPSIAERKAKGSPIGGEANIFIFPDLNAGNIGYKITERYGLFAAVGPVLQGTAQPASDLSRGCSVNDIYNVAAITLLQSRCTAGTRE